MGLLNSWIAVQGVGKDVLREKFGLEEMGEEGFAIEVASPLSYAELPGGWLIVCGDYEWAGVERVKALSRSGAALGVILNDKVDDLETKAFAAKDGELLWEVSAVDLELTVEGTPPPEFEPLHRKYTSPEATAEDELAIHEIPVELARMLCGFRADEDQPPFTGLRSVAGGPFESPRKSGCLGLLLVPLLPAALYFGHVISNS
jgi:hypothetical protein